MDSFPDDFSYEQSNASLYAINMKKYLTRLTECREYVYSTYKQALKNEDNCFYFDLEDYCPMIRNNILIEILTRFSMVYCTSSSSDKKTNLMAIDVGNTIEYTRYTNFCVVLTELFKNDITFYFHK